METHKCSHGNPKSSCYRCEVNAVRREYARRLAEKVLTREPKQVYTTSQEEAQ